MAAPPQLDLRAFREVVELDPDAPDARWYLSVAGSTALLAATMQLLAPPVVEYRGAVLLGFALDEPTVDQWFERLGDPTAVERVVNHVHLWDVLPARTSDHGEAERLVEPLAWFWRVALRERYPDREFVVDAVRSGDYGPELTFWQVRPAGS